MATNNLDFRVKNGLVVEQGATISGLTYPTVDGSADYVISTDGSGNLTLVPAKAIASNVSYDNNDSGLIASNVQSAIDELQDTKADISLLSSNITLFPTTAASDITNYNVMVTSTSDSEYNTTAVNVATGAISTTGQLIASLASGTDIIDGPIEGITITTVGNIRKTAGNNNQGASFYFEIYRRETAGTEHLIGTSNETIPIYQTDGYQQFFTSALVYNSGAIFDRTDRIVIKYYGTNHGGGNPEFDFQFGGATPVKTLIPVSVEVIVHENNAIDIQVDITNFNNILDNDNDTVQEALDAIDDMSIGDIKDVNLTTAPEVGQALIWNGTQFVAGDVAAGDSTFLALTDTPSSYADQSDRIVKVNSTGDGLDFGDIVSGSQSRESFTSTLGQTEFELEYTYGGQNSILVYVNGVPQFPGENFTLSGNTLTFTDAPDTGSQVLVYGLTPITSEITPGDGTVTAKKLAASAYTRDIFVGDGIEATFELSGDVGSALAPFVYVGGVLQDPITHYNINVLATPQTLTFTEAIPDEAEVTVVYGPVNVTGVPSDQSITFAKLANSNFEYQTFFGDGVETDFTLTQRALLPQHLIVTVAGIPQTPDGTTYTVNDTTLSFAEAPALNAKIVVRFYGTPVPIGDILDNLVTTPKILNGAVTPEKLDREYVEPLDLALVATTGSYTHLSDKPDLSVYATSTQLSTAISNLIDTAPETLDTLNELAAALNDDANFAATITNRITEAEAAAVAMAIALG